MGRAASVRNFMNFLNTAISHSPWTFEEDVRLWKAYNEYGQRWSKIAIERFHTMRSEQQIKNRWKSTVFRKFITDGFDDCKDGQTAVNVDSKNKCDDDDRTSAVLDGMTRTTIVNEQWQLSLPCILRTDAILPHAELQ
jgi:hypothetical protein